MATKSTPTKAAKKATAPAKVEAPARPEPPEGRERCVVDDEHCVGWAVNGKVCSYHAASYHPDGTPRA